jgi:hypothetical protein
MRNHKVKRETSSPSTSRKSIEGGRRAYLASPMISVQIEAITIERAADEIEEEREARR